jgi:hypothetical protein
MSVGMVIMRPTSIVVAGAGSSASVRAAGGVEFASATSLSLNGVFTADYDDYMIVCRSQGSAYASINYRLRLSGTDNTTASSYVVQNLSAVSTTVGAARSTDSFSSGGAGAVSDEQRSGQTIYMYGPALAQPTASRVVSVAGESGAALWDYAGTHNQSTAYDGITFLPNASNFSGLVAVYGLSQ